MEWTHVVSVSKLTISAGLLISHDTEIELH